MITPDAQVVDWIMVAISTLVQLAVFVWVLVLAGVDYRGFLSHWRRGLLLGLVLAALTVPVTMTNIVYFDPAAAQAGGAAADPWIAAIMRVVHAAASVVGLLVMVAWVMATYYVARHEWGRVRAVTPNHPNRAAALGAAAGTGIAFGVASTLVLWLADAKPGVFVLQMLAGYAGIAQAHPAWLATLGLLVGGVAAVAEEVQFRGALLGFLTRVTRNTTAAFWLSNALIAVLFAALHLVNTDVPAIKFTQIFLFALVLGALARQVGLTAAVVCHLSMNVVAVCGELVVPMG